MPKELITPDDDADVIAANLLGERPGDADNTQDAGPARAGKTKAPELPPSPVPGLSSEEYAKLPPEEQWRRVLEIYKLTPEDARKIQLAIVRHGHWTKTYPLWDGLLQVTFRNPGNDHRLRVARAIERLEAPTKEVVELVRMQNDLAGYLLAYDDGEQKVRLNFPERSDLKDADKLHEERLAFVKTIPTEVINFVLNALNHFVGLCSVALSNGAVGLF